MHVSGCRLAILILATLATLSLPASGQFKASLQGTVMDSTGAVIPGATVTITQEAL